MVLRSQLRMNKNIIFPFLSCILIMFTLLVLIHKSSDELSTVKKELSLCKQQHDSVYSQLQNAVEHKMHLEKSLENEKVDSKQKADEMSAALNQEKEERKKEKEDADNRFEALDQRFKLNESENKEYKDINEKVNKKLIEAQEEISKLNDKLEAMRLEKEKLLENKEKWIDNLEEKLKIYLDASQVIKKSTSETNDNNQAAIPERVDLVHPGNSTTPNINPMAVNQEDLPKQVVPPPFPQPLNEQESSVQKEMRKSLNVRGDGVKPEENVMKAPQIKNDEEKEQEQVKLGMPIGLEKNDADFQVNIVDKNGFLRRPPNFASENKNDMRASSASNNGAERQNRLEDQQQQVLPLPLSNVKEKKEEIPKNIKEEDYKGIGEDEGDETEYDDNNEQAAPKKGKIYSKDNNMGEGL